MSEHTPGPWAAHFEEAIRVKSDDGTVAIATNLHLHGRRDISEAEANAHLIASAPDLLDALEGIKEVFEIWEAEGSMDDGCRQVQSIALAAIAKARGNEGGD